MKPTRERIRLRATLAAHAKSMVAAALLSFGIDATANWTDGKGAAGVLGQPDFISGQVNQGGTLGPATMNRPQGVARDPLTGKIFIADSGNNRILRYSSTDALATGAEAEAVFGADDLSTLEGGTAANRLSNPVGVSVDTGGRLWVADNLNHRVVMYLDASTRASGAMADGLLGATTFAINPPGDSAREMYQPQDVALDSSGRLWVADWANHRVLRFDDAVAKALANAADTVSNTAPASDLLGQAGINQSAANRGGTVAANTMNLPWKLELDPSGNLWVSDAGNNRVLYFANPAGKATGADADGLLGSNSFTEVLGPAPSQSRFWGPRGLAVDSRGALWVTEEFNHRIVRFDNAAAAALANAADPLVNTALPDGVLGHPDFNTNSQATSETSLRSPWDVATSPYGDLWVAQFSNNANRVSRFRADASSYRSDTLVGLKASSLKGNNRYHLSGAGQLVKATSQNRQRLRFYASLQNDGLYSDDFTLRGTRGKKDFTVSYFSTTGGKSRVTGPVVGAGLGVNGVTAGGSRSYLIEVKPKASTKGKKKSQLLRFTATSLYNGTADQVRLRASTAK
jgi:sugar lactone lactonase YvrE